jgi:hypothetical protein
MKFVIIALIAGIASAISLEEKHYCAAACPAP